MKKLTCAVLILFLVVSAAISGYAETIYTKTGREIKAKVSEITDDTVWYEVTVGDMVECTGIGTKDVVKIENDDGTAYVGGLEE
ncbi:MAG: hypothetical protein ISS33_02865 [Candidatus Omnitrophica bacterium]|nr:hypothetical protein [Candidatus Omnitrophota bacterium]